MLWSSWTCCYQASQRSFHHQNHSWTPGERFTEELYYIHILKKSIENQVINFCWMILLVDYSAISQLIKLLLSLFLNINITSIVRVFIVSIIKFGTLLQLLKMWEKQASYPQPSIVTCYSLTCDWGLMFLVYQWGQDNSVGNRLQEKEIYTSINPNHTIKGDKLHMSPQTNTTST